MQQYGKDDLKKELAKRTNISQKDVGFLIEEFINLIVDCLESNISVKIRNFGNFSVAERKERNGLNPKTGEKIVIPAKKAAKFKFSSNVNELLNG